MGWYKYKPEFTPQAEKLCKLGAIDTELADFFEVDVSTIERWKKEHPEFGEALKRGKLIADAEVAEKLFQRATGYEHPDVDIKVVNGEIVITDLTKHHPPDTAAAIFWLKNRQRAKWMDQNGRADEIQELEIERKKLEIEALKKTDNTTMTDILKELVGKLPS